MSIPLEKIPGFVYFVQSGNGSIKIGWSRKPIHHRMSLIQVWCPEMLKVLAIETSDSANYREQELHRVFKDIRIRGEWFKPRPALLEYIDSIKLDVNRNIATNAASVLIKTLISDFGIRKEQIALDVGASIRTIERWHDGKTDPLPEFKRRLESLVEREQRRSA